MRALVVHEFGPPNSHKIEEVPDPTRSVIVKPSST